MKIVATGPNTYGFKVIVDQSKLTKSCKFLGYWAIDSNGNPLDYKNHKEIIDLGLTEKQYVDLDNKLNAILKGRIKKHQNIEDLLLEKQKNELLYLYKKLLKAQDLSYFTKHEKPQAEIEEFDKLFSLAYSESEINADHTIKITIVRTGADENIILPLPQTSNLIRMYSEMLNTVANFYPELEMLLNGFRTVRSLQMDIKKSELNELKRRFGYINNYPVVSPNSINNAFLCFLILPFVKTLPQFKSIDKSEFGISERQGLFIFDFFNLMVAFDPTFANYTTGRNFVTGREFTKALREHFKQLNRDYLHL